MHETDMNTGLRKHGLRGTASWTLQEMLKMLSLSFHADIAGSRLLGPCFCCATADRRIIYCGFQRHFFP